MELFEEEDQAVKPQRQPHGMKSRVVAEFVDEIPEAFKPIDYNKTRTRWEPQEGFREAMEKAFMHPGRPMLLVRYDIDKSKSKQKTQAMARVAALATQGYNESTGWIVRAVDNAVYVNYVGDGR